MKHRLYFLAALVALVAVGCVPQPIPEPTSNTNTNSNIVNLFGPTNPTGAGVGCLESEAVPVRVDITAPTSISVNGSSGIDATPKSASGKRSDTCNESQGILWATSDATVCTVASPNSFTTSLKCLKAGPCNLSVQVPGKGASGSTTVSCTGSAFVEVLDLDTGVLLRPEDFDPTVPRP